MTISPGSRAVCAQPCRVRNNPVMNLRLSPGLDSRAPTVHRRGIPMQLTNETMARHTFLKGMYQDEYFPDAVVKMCEDVLINLCHEIEQQKPSDLDALYALTHQATEQINELEEAFEENGSEIETVAREAITGDFIRIADAYGFTDADIEELIALREW
ncbi:hypothetical protein ALP93_05215 [Pseudomonas syringae pv. helianthi]|nr:hypothetical protein ALP93_05215 [Pseudomonas syringae pv. helianthi]